MNGRDKVGQKTQNLTGNFLLNVCGFCRKNNSESTDGQYMDFGLSVC